MRFKSLLTLATCALIGSGLVAPGVSEAAPKAPKPKPPLVVGEDPEGDWGCNDPNPCAAPDVGNELGQDLVEASIGMPDPATLNFVIKVAKLPSGGGVPEASRYTWEMLVNDTPVQISGAFTEYLRGTCNPTYNPLICPPPRDPGEAPFFIRVGGCTVGGPCEELGLVHGVFDPAEGTITIPVPLEVLGAKPKTTIAPNASLFGGAIYAAPAAVVTNASVPADTLTVAKTFTVPKPKKKKQPR
jgi:hypothetical protein